MTLDPKRRLAWRTTGTTSKVAARVLRYASAWMSLTMHDDQTQRGYTSSSGHEATSGHVVRNLTTREIGVVICGTNDGRLSIALRAGGPSVYIWDRPNVEIIGLV